MDQGPTSNNNTKLSRSKLLKKAENDLEQAKALFEQPPLSLGLSYKDLLQTMAHHPDFVRQLLASDINDLKEPEPLLTLLDGFDLTLLGSVDLELMDFILDHHADKLVGADCVSIAKNHPSLAEKIFNEEKLLAKLNGRHLAELGALNHEIAYAIKEDDLLWKRLTTHSDVGPMIENLTELKEKAKITAIEYRAKVAALLNEEQTFMHVGIVCQNNKKLAKTLVKEGYLEKLNGEDLSYFAQYHPFVIDLVFDDPNLLNRLEGNDFKRLGINHEPAAMAILNSKELMTKSGPHVWAELAAKHDEFGYEFMQAFDTAVRQYLNKKIKHERDPTGTPKPKKSDLLRFQAEFMIALAQKKGPAFAEYLYDQAVNLKNPVFRYLFKLDEPGKLFDVDALVKQMIDDFKEKGLDVTSEEVISQIALISESLNAKNEQMQSIKYTFLCSLASISPNTANALLDEMIKYPSFMKEINGANFRALAGKNAQVIERILNNPELVKKCSGAHLADMAKQSPDLLVKIWSDETMRQKIIESRSVPILCNRYLNIILEAAEHNGYLDEIIAAMKESKQQGDTDVPKGYIAYLYNILYARAEVTHAIQDLLKESNQLTNSSDELQQELTNAPAPLTLMFDQSKAKPSVAPTDQQTNKEHLKQTSR